jgi:hypothetical protein
VGLGLVGRDPPLVDEALDERVVLGDLGDHAVPHEERPGVADVGEDDLVA